MAVRGGSINSHLRIGRFFSSLIRFGHADFLVSLDATETANNKHYLKPDGLIVENSTDPNEPGIRRVAAALLARELGRVQLENVVMLGYAATLDGFPVSVEDVLGQLAREADREREAELESVAMRSRRCGKGLSCEEEQEIV